MMFQIIASKITTTVKLIILACIDIFSLCAVSWRLAYTAKVYTLLLYYFSCMIFTLVMMSPQINVYETSVSHGCEFVRAEIA